MCYLMRVLIINNNEEENLILHPMKRFKCIAGNAKLHIFCYQGSSVLSELGKLNSFARNYINKVGNKSQKCAHSEPVSQRSSYISISVTSTFGGEVLAIHTKMKSTKYHRMADKRLCKFRKTLYIGCGTYDGTICSSVKIENLK